MVNPKISGVLNYKEEEERYGLQKQVVFRKR
jgi:hypothetical protein